MNEGDLIRLRHMLEAAQIALSLVEGETRASLDADIKLRLALTKAIEIIGEAASKVTAETRTQLPAIPWTGIVGMRNVLIHGYFDIDLDKLWNTVSMNLPPLISELEKIPPPKEG